MAGMEIPACVLELTFDTQFPAIGLYALWIQVQYKGEIYTAPYVVEVTGVAEAPETTPEAHGHDHG